MSGRRSAIARAVAWTGLAATFAPGAGVRSAAAADGGTMVVATAAPPVAATAAPAAGAGGASGTGAAVPGAASADAKRLAALRRKLLKDEDFVENDETNRDPFHSYLRLFVDRTAVGKKHKVPAVFDKARLEELALIAIVSGNETPRAMFRDATGLGKTVQRGDHLSRTGARVTKILSDRVIVEITEISGTGEPRVVERAILVNPDEAP